MDEDQLLEADDLPSMTPEQVEQAKAFQKHMREINKQDIRERAAMSVQEKWRELNELIASWEALGVRQRPEPSEEELSRWIARRELLERKVRLGVAVPRD